MIETKIVMIETKNVKKITIEFICPNTGKAENANLWFDYVENQGEFYTPKVLAFINDCPCGKIHNIIFSDFQN